MLVCEVPQIIFCGIRVVTWILFVPFMIDSGKDFFVAVYTKKSCEFCYRKIEKQFCVDEKKKEETVMKAITKSKTNFLSDYTSLVVIAIAVVTFFVPAMIGW